jgi:hypothetical protein
MRVLHVVDHSDHTSLAPLACDTLVRRAPGRHTLWAVGHAPSPRVIAAPERRFAARLGRPALSFLSLRAPLRQAAGRHDLIVCWSPATLAAACAALPRNRIPLVGVFTSPPSATTNPVGARLLRTALDRATTVCFSEAADTFWRNAGASDARRVPPVARFDTADLPAREEVRARLGIKPHERTLALFADPPHLGDARRFAYLSGLLGIGGVPTVGLVHARSAQLRRGARFLRECGRAWRFIAADVPLADVLPAADAALCDTQVIPTHPLRTPGAECHPPLTADALAPSLAAAAGVPLIFPRVALADELRAAGLSITIAADVSALSLASAAFAVLDNPAAHRPAPLPADAPDAIDAIVELLRERLNAPLPGFPLSPSHPVPLPSLA